MLERKHQQSMYRGGPTTVFDVNIICKQLTQNDTTLLIIKTTALFNRVQKQFLCSKPRPNVPNISTQQITTLLHHLIKGLDKRMQHFNATYHNIAAHMLHTVGHPDAICCGMLDSVRRTWPNEYNFMQHLNVG